MYVQVSSMVHNFDAKPANENLIHITSWYGGLLTIYTIV